LRRIPFHFLVQACVWIGVLIHAPAFAETYLESFLRTTTIAPGREIRAAWVVRNSLDSKADADRAVDYAIQARFQLLFVQVRGRADAYYRSSLEPEGLSLDQPVAQFDPLDYFLKRCREAGISVHAWVNVFLVWSDGSRAPPVGHIVAEHPEWLVTSVSGARMDQRPLGEWLAEGQTGYFVSPARADVREHTTRVIQEIATRYAVDGIHLDYIRYPGPQFDFGAAERTAFALRYGIDPLWFSGPGRWDSENPNRWLLEETGVPETLDSLRVEWRAAQVESLIVNVRRAIPGVPLSAAVMPEPDRARADEGQDWIGWVQKGLVDFVVPMAYTQEPGALDRLIERVRRMIGVERLLVGLPVFDGRERYLGYSVSLLRRQGVMGYSLFSANELEKEAFSVPFLERVFLDTSAEEPAGDASAPDDSTSENPR
jgi:uncharacterized lipoprotein YddW (UPF0748 family)